MYPLAITFDATTCFLPSPLGSLQQRTAFVLELDLASSATTVPDGSREVALLGPRERRVGPLELVLLRRVVGLIVHRSAPS